MLYGDGDLLAMGSIVIIAADDSVPINHIPPLVDILWASVLVLQVIGMFPDIQPQNRDHRNLSDPLHERIVLVGSRADVEASVGLDSKPCPAGSETVGSSLVKGLAHSLDGAPSIFDLGLESTRGALAGLTHGGHPLPEQGVIVMTTT